VKLKTIGVGVFALASACGRELPPPPAPPEWTCPHIGGNFYAYSFLRATEGTCGVAPKYSSGKVEFSDGQFVSPLGALLRCDTTQDDCAVDITCTTNVIRAKMTYDGTMKADGGSFYGVARIDGSYQGCTSVTYGVILMPAPAP
jgi:hypothetical protein